MCKNAIDSTFVPETDVKLVAQGNEYIMNSDKKCLSCYPNSDSVIVSNLTGSLTFQYNTRHYQSISFSGNPLGL